MGLMLKMVMVMMMVVMTLGITANTSNGEPLTDYQRLVMKLKAANQDRTRPVAAHNHTTTVSFALSPRWVTLDDGLQLLTVEAWAFMMWTDAHLDWSPAEFGGITEVHLDAADIWLPDVALYNRVGGDDAPTFGSVPVLVKSAGAVMWFPPAYFKVPCVLDLTLWPRDQHNCSLSLGSWAHYGDQVDLDLLASLGPQPGVIMGDLQTSASWKVLNVTATKNTQKIASESHVDLEFAVVVQRRANERAAYIDSTMLVATIAVLFAYYVPVLQLHTRVLLHVFALTVLVMCYLVLYSTLPSYGGPVPLVVNSYRGAMTLSLLSLLCVVWLHAFATVPYSASVCWVLGRICRSRKVVGTYDTLVEEQPDVAQATPPAQMPSTTSGTTSPHTVIAVTSGTETNFGGTTNNITSGDGTLAQNTEENHAESTTTAAENSKRRANDVTNRMRVANFLTGVFFAATFLVDYIALRVILGA